MFTKLTLLKVMSYKGRIWNFIFILVISMHSHWKKLLYYSKFSVITTPGEKCPNTELFLVRIFPHSDWIWRDTSYLSEFSLNAGKNGPEITPYLETFHFITTSNEQYSVRSISPFFTRFLHVNVATFSCNYSKI